MLSLLGGSFNFSHNLCNINFGKIIFHSIYCIGSIYGLNIVHCKLYGRCRNNRLNIGFLRIIILATESGGIKSFDHTLECCMKIVGRSNDIRNVQHLIGILMSIGQTENSSENLLYIN